MDSPHVQCTAVARALEASSHELCRIIQDEDRPASQFSILALSAALGMAIARDAKEAGVPFEGDYVAQTLDAALTGTRDFARRGIGSNEVLREILEKSRG